jgi:methylase of polypeptide subunit release factors
LSSKYFPESEPVNCLDPPRLPKSTSVTILDVCTGSGCIALHLKSLLQEKLPEVKIYGWDISTDSISLAKKNLDWNTKLGEISSTPRSPMVFKLVDIFEKWEVLQNQLMSQASLPFQIDIIVSNPPYISRNSFDKEVKRSVRSFEPKLALVPEKPKPSSYAYDEADIFYHRLLQLFCWHFKSRVLVMEIGDEEQARRVVSMAKDICGALCSIEIWRDYPANLSQTGELQVDDWIIPIRGSGNFRVVALYAFGDSKNTRSR